MADISDSEMKLVLGIVNTKYIEIDQIFTISINQQDYFDFNSVSQTNGKCLHRYKYS